VHLFELNSWILAVVIFLLVYAAATGTYLVARRLRHRSEHLREPYGVLQAALFGVVALVLAFGLSLAVGRYDARRAAVVAEANAIGTTYLRAETIPEPMRSESLALLVAYTDTAIALANSVPESDAARQAIDEGDDLQDQLWTLAGQALEASPEGTATRLYVESLNEMTDQDPVRTPPLNNRFPSTVLALEILAAMCAIGLLALVLAFIGRTIAPALVPGTFIATLLAVTSNPDRPTRGTIRVPDAPLTDVRSSMDDAPAAAAPEEP